MHGSAVLSTHSHKPNRLQHVWTKLTDHLKLSRPLSPELFTVSRHTKATIDFLLMDSADLDTEFQTISFRPCVVFSELFSLKSFVLCPSGPCSIMPCYSVCPSALRSPPTYWWWSSVHWWVSNMLERSRTVPDGLCSVISTHFICYWFLWVKNIIFGFFV